MYLKLNNGDPQDVLREVARIDRVSEQQTVQTPDGPQTVTVSMASLSAQERFDQFGWAEQLVTSSPPVTVPELETKQIDPATRTLNGIVVEVDEVNVDRPFEEAQQLVKQKVIARWVESYRGGTTTADGIAIYTNGGATDLNSTSGVVDYLVAEWLTRKGLMTFPNVGLPIMYPKVAGGEKVEKFNATEFTNLEIALAAHYNAAFDAGAAKVVAVNQAATKADLQLVLDDLDNGWPPPPVPPV